MAGTSFVLENGIQAWLTRQPIIEKLYPSVRFRIASRVTAFAYPGYAHPFPISEHQLCNINSIALSQPSRLVLGLPVCVILGLGPVLVCCQTWKVGRRRLLLNDWAGVFIRGSLGSASWNVIRGSCDPAKNRPCENLEACKVLSNLENLTETTFFRLSACLGSISAYWLCLVPSSYSCQVALHFLELQLVL